MSQNKNSNVFVKQQDSNSNLEFEMCTLCNKNTRSHNDLCDECDEKIEMRANSLNNEKIISGKYDVIQNMTRFVNKYVFNNNNYNYSIMNTNTNISNNCTNNSSNSNSSNSNSNSNVSPIQLSQGEFGALMNKIHPILVCNIFSCVCFVLEKCVACGTLNVFGITSSKKICVGSSCVTSNFIICTHGTTMGQTCIRHKSTRVQITTITT